MRLSYLENPRPVFGKAGDKQFLVAISGSRAQVIQGRAGHFARPLESVDRLPNHATRLVQQDQDALAESSSSIF
ncbi:MULTISPECIES: hypothetical protein [unclassified Variovorax]|uniref:hypothetical protein n=1 Tax=unclassified Variovorax TaxID=663243 RepID=UPI001BD48E2B|nr:MULTISPECIES: hypothetical protein [unclassified Variovorax]